MSILLSSPANPLLSTIQLFLIKHSKYTPTHSHPHYSHSANSLWAPTPHRDGPETICWEPSTRSGTAEIRVKIIHQKSIRIWIGILRRRRAFHPRSWPRHCSRSRSTDSWPARVKRTPSWQHGGGASLYVGCDMWCKGWRKRFGRLVVKRVDEIDHRQVLSDSYLSHIHRLYMSLDRFVTSGIS
jgi:hypothetical protein